MAIGIIDSGVGGLTSLVELARALPHENIVYCGDTGNAPYGNRNGEEIVCLTRHLLNFLQQQQVKAVAVACNTISSTFNTARYAHYEIHCGFPVISVIQPVIEQLNLQCDDKIGLIATVFTVQAGYHAQLLQQQYPGTRIYSVASERLAGLIERGITSFSEIKQEIASCLQVLLQQQPDMKKVILGCTHYPIVQTLFEAAAPQIRFINPAYAQAMAIQHYLTANALLAPACQQRQITLYTSGHEHSYRAVLQQLGLQEKVAIHTVNFQCSPQHILS